jgi:hypothetical protein
LATLAPKTEIGSVEALPGWSSFAVSTADSTEPPAWVGSQRVQTVNQMRVDSQVSSLCDSVTMPILRMEWTLNPNGARDEVVQQVSTDLGIPIKGSNEVAPRSRRRFKHRDHLEHALLAPWYGHMFFEQVPDTENFDLAKDGWRLRKLAPRMPGSIQDILISRDGGLSGINQFGHIPKFYGTSIRQGLNYLRESTPQIPVSALAAYVWKREGSNWYGRSMLRPMYRDWVLKDRALRVDSMKNERFGLGIPTATAPPGGDPNEYAKLAQSMRASENGGVGLANGATVGIEGVRGTLPDIMASIRYYDESMARTFMAMVVQLGQTQTGSRALGETFADFFQMLVEAIANWYRDTTNEHVINDLVDWNFGEDEQAPLLEWSYPQGEQALAITDLTSMVTAGVITMDAETERAVRQRTRLPSLPEKDEALIDAASSPFSSVGLPALVLSGILSPDDARALLGVTGPAPTPKAVENVISAMRPELTKDVLQKAVHSAFPDLPNKPGRRFEARKQTADSPAIGHREPSVVELASKTDFEVLQETWQAQTTDTVADWRKDVQKEQIEDILRQVRAAVDAGDLVALSRLEAPVLGADLLFDRMKELAEDAIVGARAEALAQGVSIGTVNTATTVEPLLASRAESTANLLSRGIADSASRAAINLGTGLAADEVVDAVREHLDGLSDAYLNDMLGGSMTQAQNTGRKAVFNEKPATIYASELLDQNTCERCSAIDGKKFEDMLGAEQEYPTGGHKDCLGGPRCRGTLVAVYDEAGPSSLDPEDEVAPSPINNDPIPGDDELTDVEIPGDEPTQEELESIFRSIDGDEKEKAFAVYEELGFNGTPTVVGSIEEVEAAADLGPSDILHRVVSDEDFASQYATGTHFIGDGISGTGTYTVEGSQELFEEYIERALPSSASGTQMTMTLAEDAKVFTGTSKDLSKLLDDFPDSAFSDAADPSLILASQGYDAVRLTRTKETFVIVLNRSKVIIAP